MIPRSASNAPATKITVVAQGVEVVGVVGRQRHCQPKHRGSDRPDPGPQLPAPDSVSDKEQHRQPGGGDKAGHRDMQVADVVDQVWAELLDGVLAHRDLVGADA
jgi:hypothetical protein